MLDTGATWDWLKSGDNLKGAGTLIGGLGSVYSGIKQADAADKMVGLQTDQYNFNKSMILDDEKRRKQAQANYDGALGMKL
jgi:hypothetical protein